MDYIKRREREMEKRNKKRKEKKWKCKHWEQFTHIYNNESKSNLYPKGLLDLKRLLIVYLVLDIENYFTASIFLNSLSCRSEKDNTLSEKTIRDFQVYMNDLSSTQDCKQHASITN